MGEMLVLNLLLVQNFSASANSPLLLLVVIDFTGRGRVYTRRLEHCRLILLYTSVAGETRVHAQ